VVKSDTAELSKESSLTSLKVNLLVLIMQLIMLSKDIGSWMVLVGSDSPDKFANLDDSIRHQMVQLHVKFV
jgi:hypothetical protein